MFDRYLIREGSLRNVVRGGAVVGFEFDVRITYYRGLGLSMIEGFDVTIDGETFPRAAVVFSLRGRSYTFDELAREAEERWEMTEAATLFIARPGGLRPGPHVIEVIENLRISYLPYPGIGRDSKVLSVAA